MRLGRKANGSRKRDGRAIERQNHGKGPGIAIMFPGGIRSVITPQKLMVYMLEFYVVAGVVGPMITNN